MYFSVSLIYSLVNLILALIILVRSWRNVLSKFHAFCVTILVILGATGFLSGVWMQPVVMGILHEVSAFIYAVFPFFFLHFMLIFIRRYEVLKSRTIIIAVYFAGLFSYTLTLLGLLPNPFVTPNGISDGGYIYYITWNSILFSVGVALLYSLIGGFRERGMKTNILFTTFVLLMLLLPTPFTLSIFSVFSSEAIVLFTISSTTSLAIVIYFIFRHRITMNTPYQAMKSALAAMNDILIKTTVDYTIDMAQGAVLPLLGYQESELAGRSFVNLTKNGDLLWEYRERALKSTKLGEGFFTLELVSKDGKSLWMDYSFTPVLANEEVVGFVGVGRNITERRQAEMALQESEARYRLLAENSTDLISVLTLDGKFIYASPASRTLLGYEPDKLVGQSLEEFVHPEDRERLWNNRRNDPNQPPISPESYRMKESHGSYVWFETTSRIVTHPITGRPDHISAVSRDVTERVWAAQELRKSEERYRRFFEDDLTGAVRTTPGGRILDCNPAFLRIFGFPNTEAALAYDENKFYPDSAVREKLLRTLTEKRKLVDYDLELRTITGEPVTIVANMIGTFDEQGLITQILTYVNDNTEKKKLESHLRQAQKMENLGSLAGGIAHDFNNILGILAIHAEILNRPTVTHDRQRNSIDAISQTVKRGKALVRQLLTFARKTDVLFESVQINGVIDEIVKILQPTFPKTIIFERRLADGLPSIAADANQLHQALLNLCVNARDAMPSGGRLTLSTNMMEGAAVKSRFRDATGEHYVCVGVTDTGTGMDEATKNRIFEPFFTTKEKGKGTGLGLAVAYGVVKSHHGFIDVESDPGHGTTFRLYIEVPRKTIQSTEGTSVEAAAGGRGETLLVVEDEEMLLDPLKEVLTDEGYRVLTAKDGVEAVNTYKNESGKIALVLIDMGLPRLGGREAFLLMKEHNPRVRAIVASGQMDPETRADLSRNGIEQFIEKPYQISDVLNRVRKVIERNGSR